VVVGLVLGFVWLGTFFIGTGGYGVTKTPDGIFITQAFRVQVSESDEGRRRRLLYVHRDLRGKPRKVEIIQIHYLESHTYTYWVVENPVLEDSTHLGPASPRLMGLLKEFNAHYGGRN